MSLLRDIPTVVTNVVKAVGFTAVLARDVIRDTLRGLY